MSFTKTQRSVLCFRTGKWSLWSKCYIEGVLVHQHPECLSLEEACWTGKLVVSEPCRQVQDNQPST